MKTSDRPGLALKTHTAANGFKLLQVRDRSNPIVSLQLYIKSGSACESEDQRGYAHLLEHLVFKSTALFPDNRLSHYASDVGAILNAYTDFDATCYYLTVPRDKMHEGMVILSEMARHSRFNQKDLQTERQIILEEIYQYKAEPDSDFLEYIQGSYFVDSPLTHPVLGDKSCLKKASVKSVKSFYEEHYTPENSFLVACGDFDDDSLIASFTKLFATWQGKAPKECIYDGGTQDTFRFFCRNKKGREYLAFILPELPEKHPHSECLHIAIRHLAIGKSSLLHKRLVEEDRLCAYVRVSSLSGMQAGVSAIVMAPTKPDCRAQIVQTFYESWWQVIEEGVPAESLKLIRSDIIHNWLYSFDGVENISTLVAAEEFNKDLNRIFTYGAELESIDNSDVINAVRRYWHIDKLAFYYQGSKSISPAMSKIFTRYQSLDFPKCDPNFRAQNTVEKPKKLITSGAENPSFPKYHQFKLENGMTFVYNHQPGKDICGFALSFPLSQLNEHKSAVNYFASSLMVHDTQDKDHAEIMRFSRQRGFNIRVFHHIDSTIFRGKCHSSNLRDALGLLSEIITKPRPNKGHLNTLKNSASENMRREKDYPVSHAYIKWFNSLFGAKNNLLYPTANLKAIADVKLSDCEDWLNTMQAGTSQCLAVVGSMEPERALEYAQELFGTKLSYKEERAFHPIYEEQKPKLYRDYKKIDQAIIYCGGYASPASNHVENTAFHVLAHLMGGDITSRLYWSLRENNGYAYQTGFDFSGIQDLGYWNSYVLCDPDQYKSSLKALRGIIKETIQEGFNEEELSRAKTYLCAISLMDNESAAFKAAAISNLICLGYDLDYYLSRDSRIREVDLDILNYLAKEYLSEDKQYTYVMV